MMRRAMLASVAMSLAATTAGGQTPRGTSPGGSPGSVLPVGCTTARIALAPTDSARRAARDLAQRGQQAAILGDRASARTQLRDAAALDPVDPDLAYQLARAHEGAGSSSEAVAEYCRFLSLAPDAPEAPEARERVAVLGAEAQQREALAARAARGAVPPLPTLSPRRALALGLLLPGGGQFYAGRPVRGMLAFGGAALALGYGMSARLDLTPVEVTAVDPFGNPYTYTAMQETTTRPHLAQGFLLAGAVAVASAIDAYGFSRRARDQGGVAVDLMPSGSTLALRVSIR
jgi:hypothetical protein